MKSGGQLQSGNCRFCTLMYSSISGLGHDIVPSSISSYFFTLASAFQTQLDDMKRDQRTPGLVEFR